MHALIIMSAQCGHPPTQLRCAATHWDHHVGCFYTFTPKAFFCIAWHCWQDICQRLVKRSSINFGLIQQPSTYPSKLTSASSKLIGISNHLSTSPQPPSININSRKHHSKTAAALSLMLLVMVLMVLKMASMVMVIHIKRETEVGSILVKWLPALSALLTYSHHTTSSGADRWFGKDSTLFIHTHA